MTLSSSHTKASRAHKALPATFTVPRSLEEGGEEKIAGWGRCLTGTLFWPGRGVDTQEGACKDLVQHKTLGRVAENSLGAQWPEWPWDEF